MRFSVGLMLVLISAQLAWSVQSKFTPQLSVSDHMIEREAEIFRANRIRNIERRKNMPKYEIGQADIIDYDIECRVKPTMKYLETKAKVIFKSLVDGLSDITLVMYDDSLNIAYVVQGTDTLTYGYDPYWGFIFINLKTPVPLDQLDSIVISYSGNITSEVSGIYNYRGQLDSIYSYATYCPDLWYPYSYENYYSDRLDDKATAEIKLTVPSGYIALSNGFLSDSIISDSVNIFQWSIKQPIPEFNFAISPFWHSTVPYGSISLSCYDPDSADPRDEMLGILNSVVSCYSKRFGEYSLEKLALADNGSTFGYGSNSLIILPLPANYSFMAHETAHEWWGQMVSLRYWDEVWLNEGFASYSSALFAEDSLGEIERDAFLNNWSYTYKYYAARYTDCSIVPAPWSSQMYYSIVYLKGAWVLHMLRGVMGDSGLNDLMKKYGTDYGCHDSSVTIGMFRQTAEQVYGNELGWFFDQWLYHPGYPFYKTVYYFNTHQNNLSAHIKISQTSSSFADPMTYKMPLEIDILHDSLWNGKAVIWDSLSRQDFWINDTLSMTQLSLDRENKVLKDTYNSLPSLWYLTSEMHLGKLQVMAAWNRFVADSTCISYNLYRGLSYDGLYSRVNSAAITDTTFTDTTVSEGTEYFYAVTAIDSADSCYETRYSNIISTTPSGVMEKPGNLGGDNIYSLEQNTPNPFKQLTIINYQLTRPGLATLKVYNVQGQLVKTLVNGTQPAGRHQAQWNGRDEGGRIISSGIYFARLEAEGRTITRTLQYIK